jgi:hypothetical protein
MAGSGKSLKRQHSQLLGISMLAKADGEPRNLSKNG